MHSTPPELDRRNCGTICRSVGIPRPPPLEEVERRELMASAAYEAALELRWANRVDAPGAWLVVHRRRNGWHGELISSERGSALVVGRHDQCRAQLDEHPEVSLRHVLVRLLPTGSPGEVEVVDLRSAGGARVHRGGVWERMALRGPVVLEVAGQPVAIVPMDGQLPDAPPEPEVENTMPAARRQRSAMESSFSSFGTLVTGGPRSMRDPKKGALRGWFRLRSRGRGKELAVYQDDLARGILLGRYDRCESRVPGIELSNNVSRVHAFLVEDRDGIRVHDTASTNGIWAGPSGGRMVSSFVFAPRRPTSFWLSDDLRVGWHPV